MGIKGLAAYLKLRLDGVFTPAVIPHNATLCIDGDGWMFDMAERNSPTVNIDLGGSYQAYAAAITAEVQLLRSYGLRLLVFFDGPLSQMKSATAEERRRQRREQWLNYCSYCEDSASFHRNNNNNNNQHSSSNSSHNSNRFPLPPLCKTQLRQTLQTNEVQIVDCDGEADQTIASFVFDCNEQLVVPEDGIDRFYAYGRDSDYMLMRSCPYIEFGTISRSTMMGPASNVLIIAERVWRRNSICESLQISESQLVDWAILCGNDFTSHFPLNSFSFSAVGKGGGGDGDAGGAGSAGDSAVLENWPVCTTRILQRGSVARYQFMDELLAEVIERGNSLVVSLAATPVSKTAEEGFSSADVQLAIEFCRCYYNLYSLSAFPVDNDRSLTDAQSEEGGVLYTGNCSSLLSGLEEFLSESFEEGGSSMSDLNIGELAVSYFRWSNSNRISKEEGEEENEVRKDKAQLEQLLSITEEQLTAMSCMLKTLESNCSSSSRSSSSSSTISYTAGRPQWTNVVAAHCFQKACKAVATAASQYAAVLPPFNPSMIFDGALFHQLMHQQWIAQGLQPSSGAAMASSPEAMTAAVSTSAAAVAEALSHVLPIEEYRDLILQRIQRDRVTVIHGETGCGKSSSVPRYILEDMNARGTRCKLFISQPRRIAVTALFRRLRETMGSKVGMRMGHGIRDEDHAETQVSFVTTGYLVRCLAHRPETFGSFTHLIIDEVHERSVDGDLVCLLVRDLLSMYPKLRIVLMSATIHTELYRQYFEDSDDGTFGPMDCISVGARRFPVTTHYAEDILKMMNPMAAPAAAVKEVLDMTRNIKHPEETDPPSKLPQVQWRAAVRLLLTVGVYGSGVLLFVSGIEDITELCILLEPFEQFLVFPIHSSIPEEEQDMAFNPTPVDKIKVVVATNAAESSVTIPDIDIVICLGRQKALKYDSKIHRTVLVNTWISKSSATQRAGRTGRVRPGTVYRLYSKNLHDHFAPHEQAEVHRRPLQDVVLNMWTMLESVPTFAGVTPMLERLIEPPDVRNIEKSYDNLHKCGLITHPSDEQGQLTAIGRLVGKLPVDIALGRLLCFGVQLGVAAEAVVIAAALCLPKSPFRFANSAYHEPDEYHSIVRKKFMASLKFDAGRYSEPIMLMRLLSSWRKVGQTPHKQFVWAQKYGIIMSVMKQFKSVADNLAHTLSNSTIQYSSFYGRPAQEIDIVNMPTLTPSKLNILRMILLWTSSENVLCLAPLSKTKQMKRLEARSKVSIDRSSGLTRAHLDTILVGSSGDNIEFQLVQKGIRTYDARISYWDVTAGLKTTSWLRVANSLTNMAKKLSLDCFWTVVQSADSSKTVELVFFVLNYTASSASILDNLMSFVFQDKEDRCMEALMAGNRIRNNMKESCSANKASAISTELLDAMAIFAMSDMRKSEHKLLNDYRSQLPDCISGVSMLIPSVGNAKLFAFNVVPSEEALDEIFHGTVGTGADSDTDTGTAVGKIKEKESTKGKKIACQVQNSKSVIVFPNVDDDNVEDGNLEYTLTPPMNRPLLQDLAVGHRLLSCCMQRVGEDRSPYYILFDKDVSFKKTSSAAAATGKGSGSPAKKAAVVPGTAEFAALHQSQRKQSPLAEGDELASAKDKCEEKLAVKIECVVPVWRNVLFNNNEADRKTMLSRQMMMSCSVHCGTEQVFAVAYSSLLVGHGGKMAVCEGITVLPPGVAWVVLAMVCSGSEKGTTDVLLRLATSKRDRFFLRERSGSSNDGKGDDSNDYYCDYKDDRDDDDDEEEGDLSAMERARRVATLLHSVEDILLQPDIIRNIDRIFGIGKDDASNVSSDKEEEEEEEEGVDDMDRKEEKYKRTKASRTTAAAAAAKYSPSSRRPAGWREEDHPSTSTAYNYNASTTVMQEKQVQGTAASAAAAAAASTTSSSYSQRSELGVSRSGKKLSPSKSSIGGPPRQEEQKHQKLLANTNSKEVCAPSMSINKKKSANKSKPLVSRAPIEAKPVKYRCPTCLSPFAALKPCIEHAKKVCNITHISSVIEFQRLCWAREDMPPPDLPPMKYRCQACHIEFAKWGECVKHMKNVCKVAPDTTKSAKDTTKSLRRGCRLRDAKKPQKMRNAQTDESIADSSCSEDDASSTAADYQYQDFMDEGILGMTVIPDPGAGVGAAGAAGAAGGGSKAKPAGMRKKQESLPQKEPNGKTRPEPTAVAAAAAAAAKTTTTTTTGAAMAAAAAAAASTTVPVPSYRCPVCLTGFGKLLKCLTHARSVCDMVHLPKTANKLSELQRLLLKPPTDDAASKMEQQQRQQQQKAVAAAAQQQQQQQQQPDEKVSHEPAVVDPPLAEYFCHSCDAGFAKWGPCVDHMRTVCMVAAPKGGFQKEDLRNRI